MCVMLWQGRNGSSIPETAHGPGSLQTRTLSRFRGVPDVLVRGVRLQKEAASASHGWAVRQEPCEEAGPAAQVVWPSVARGPCAMGCERQEAFPLSALEADCCLGSLGLSAASFPPSPGRFPQAADALSD